MTSDSYKKALEDLKRELRDLVSKRDDANAGIDRVKHGITGLANMLPTPDDAMSQLDEMNEIIGPSGLTDAIRRVLRAAGKRGLTPVQTREALTYSGFDLTGYSNPLSAIHTILKRLVTSSEAKAIDGDETSYQWIPTGKIGRR